MFQSTVFEIRRTLRSLSRRLTLDVRRLTLELIRSKCIPFSAELEGVELPPPHFGLRTDAVTVSFS